MNKKINLISNKLYIKEIKYLKVLVYNNKLLNI